MRCSRLWLRSCLASLSLLAAACAGPRPASTTRPSLLPWFELVGAQAVPGIGAGQGVETRDGFVYLYGDAETGVIREYRFSRSPEPQLAWTGREIRLTRGGADLISHPTGLTFHPTHGTFIGNTVRGRGTIFHLDWGRMLADGHLDRAVLHEIADDLAVNGTRPEFVPRDGRWLVATADYGDKGNRLRWYEPQALSKAGRTSDAGVLCAEEPCVPWVQSLCWLSQVNVLVFVQNEREGAGWRMSYMPCDGRPGPGNVLSQADFARRGELEGCHQVDDEHYVLLTSSRRENVYFARISRIRRSVDAVVDR